MFGTAPIASTIGSFPEFIQNGANGYLMNDYNFTTLKKTVYSAFENRKKLFENSRSNFFQKFYFANYANEMKHIVENMFLALIIANRNGMEKTFIKAKKSKGNIRQFPLLKMLQHESTRI
jgi:hypothetical protein